MSPAGCLHTAVRRRNFIRADEMPYDVGMLYRDGNPLVYDGGNFHATLEAALEASAYRSIRGEQVTLRGRGVCRGEPVFEESSYASVPSVTFAHAVHVDVDPETGAVKLIRYVVAHDCGRVLNPMLVDGQIHGGVAQGIGEASTSRCATTRRGSS
jgi:CO/xanthine dehydrogenase Mo-binding subunit